jgi:peptide-methionine (S)-S-oxide reductase
MDSRAKDFGDTMIDGVNFDIGKVSFVVGGGGYFDGLHETVVGMKAGEKKDVSIDAGYGDYQEEGIIKAPIEQAPDGLKPGMTVQLQANQGIVQATVTAVDAETVTLDMNHPLAGCKYLLDVTVEKVEPASQFETATFAGGCFWGLELAYQREPGVVFTAVGYTQGDKEEPTYQEVCSGTTGHTEAVQVLFDPREVSYKRLCELLVERLENNLYLLNQVGNDRGTQYRHGIYPHTPEQEATAKEVLEAVGDHPSLGPVQTEVKSAGKFWTAEDYHLQYLQKGGQSAKKKAEETIRCYG